MDWITEYIEVVATVCGLIGLVIGGGLYFHLRKSSQTQKIGRGASGIQAGRDIRVGGEAKPKDR